MTMGRLITAAFFIGIMGLFEIVNVYAMIPPIDRIGGDSSPAQPNHSADTGNDGDVVGSWLITVRMGTSADSVSQSINGNSASSPSTNGNGNGPSASLGERFHTAFLQIHRDWTGSFPVMNVHANQHAIDQLRTQSFIVSAERDGIVSIMAQSGPPFNDLIEGEYPWGVDAIRSGTAWATLKKDLHRPTALPGSHLGICILDTGIDFNQPEFIRSDNSIVIENKNFVGDGHPNAQDGHSHGTHVAGTIAAQLNSKGVVGVAYGVGLFIARVLDDTGSGAWSGVIDGIAWCASFQTHTTYPVRVASLSLGGTGAPAAVQTAFDTAYNNGNGLLIIARVAIAVQIR